MTTNYQFHDRTALSKGLISLLQQLSASLSLTKPLNVYLAGGMAFHLYTASRITTDVDAEFGARVFIPDDLVVEVTLDDGTQNVLYFDKNYNSTFALMHENYQTDAIDVDVGIPMIHLKVLSPVDLVVSKIARFAANDKDDIAAMVRLGLVSSEEVEHRASSALEGFIGGKTMLQLNIRDAVALAGAEESQLIAKRCKDLPRLKSQVGSALTLLKHATNAMTKYGVEGVNWSEVEQKTIEESISKNGQNPDDVADVLCRYSPGAVTTDKQNKIRTLIDQVYPEYQVQYNQSRGHNMNHKSI